ncbi:MAG: hypothetical protein AB8G23_02795 [Myxococcota bacterium]
MTELALQDVAFLYVADELDPAERAEIEQRLAAGDPALQAALDEAAELLGMLPLALEAKQPRAGIETELIERAERLSGSGISAASTPSSTSYAAETSASTSGNMTEPAGRVIPLRWVGGGLLGLAASMALMLGGAFIASEQLKGTGGSADPDASIEAAFRAAELRNAELTRSLADLRLSESEIRIQLSESEADRRIAETALQALKQAQQATPQSQERGSELAASATSDSSDTSATTKVADLQSRIGLLESELGAARAQSARSRALLEEAVAAGEQIAAVSQDLTEAQRALDLVRAPDVGIVDLFPTREDGPSSASVFWDAGLRDCYLHANGLAQLSGDERYALWIEFDAGRVVRVSDFEADGRGNAEFFAALPQGEGEIKRTFVTLETEARRSSPRGTVVLQELARAGSGGSGEPAGQQRRRYRRRTL